MSGAFHKLHASLVANIDPLIAEPAGVVQHFPALIRRQIPDSLKNFLFEHVGFFE